MHLHTAQNFISPSAHCDEHVNSSSRALDELADELFKNGKLELLIH